MWTATYNRAQQHLNEATRRFDVFWWMTDDERAEQEQIAALAQERLDDLERDYEYRISSGWRP